MACVLGIIRNIWPHGRKIVNEGLVSCLTARQLKVKRVYRRLDECVPSAAADLTYAEINEEKQDSVPAPVGGASGDRLFDKWLA